MIPSLNKRFRLLHSNSVTPLIVPAVSMFFLSMLKVKWSNKLIDVRPEFLCVNF